MATYARLSSPRPNYLATYGNHGHACSCVFLVPPCSSLSLCSKRPIAAKPPATNQPQVANISYQAVVKTIAHAVFSFVSPISFEKTKLILCWLLLLLKTCSRSCQLLLVVLFKNVCHSVITSQQQKARSSPPVPQPSPFDGVLMLQRSGDPGRRGVDPARPQP